MSALSTTLTSRSSSSLSSKPLQCLRLFFLSLFIALVVFPLQFCEEDCQVSRLATCPTAVGYFFPVRVIGPALQISSHMDVPLAAFPLAPSPAVVAPPLSPTLV